jgi:uncharacterized protein
MVSDILAKCAGFEWDKHNTEKIKTKHDVTAVECEQIFFNIPVIAGEDVKHSKIENRFYVLGQTDAGRLLFMVFTVRNDKLRVISARDMNRKERRVYQIHEEENTPV